MKTCSKCRVEKPLHDFSKDASQKDGKQHRCKSCINNYNRSRTKSCDCGTLIKKSSTSCKPCAGMKRSLQAETITLGELKNRYKGKGTVHADTIRGLARSKYRGEFTECFYCSYKEHIDLCHIKDIKLFDDSATISAINDRSNLVALCKIHHWEFDNGYIFEGLDSSFKVLNGKKATKIIF